MATLAWQHFTNEVYLTDLRREGVLPLFDRGSRLHDVVIVGEGGVDEGEVPVQRLDHLRRRAVRHEVVRVRRVPEDVELGSGFEVLSMFFVKYLLTWKRKRLCDTRRRTCLT